MSATFNATPVIWIHVEDRGRGPFDIGHRVYDWLREADIRPVASIGPVPWCYAGGFAPDDAERVVAWLRENGCAQERSG